MVDTSPGAPWVTGRCPKSRWTAKGRTQGSPQCSNKTLSSTLLMSLSDSGPVIVQFVKQSHTHSIISNPNSGLVPVDYESGFTISLPYCMTQLIDRLNCKSNKLDFFLRHLRDWWTNHYTFIHFRDQNRIVFFFSKFDVLWYFTKDNICHRTELR